MYTKYVYHCTSREWAFCMNGAGEGRERRGEARQGLLEDKHSMGSSGKLCNREEASVLPPTPKCLDTPSPEKFILCFLSLLNACFLSLRNVINSCRFNYHLSVDNWDIFWVIFDFFHFPKTQSLGLDISFFLMSATHAFLISPQT